MYCSSHINSNMWLVNSRNVGVCNLKRFMNWMCANCCWNVTACRHKRIVTTNVVVTGHDEAPLGTDCGRRGCRPKRFAEVCLSDSDVRRRTRTLSVPPQSRGRSGCVVVQCTQHIATQPDVALTDTQKYTVECGPVHDELDRTVNYWQP